MRLALGACVLVAAALPAWAADPAAPATPAGPAVTGSTGSAATPRSRGPRIIKPPPAVPPEKAAPPVAGIPLVNPGFESTAPGKVGSPDGWWAVQHAGPLSYTFELDTTIVHAGERSLRVTSVGPEPFGAVYQKLEAKAWRGRTLRFSGWLRTEGTTGNRYGAGAGLKLHSTRGGYPLEVAEMRHDAVHGTTDWTRYEIALKVPQEAEHIEAGLVLFGPGTVWFDGASLDLMGD